MRLQKTSPVSTLPRWPRCKNVQQQSVRKHMTSRWFCEGIFVNEVIPKLNKTLPGIFNIRVLPDLSLFAVSFTGSSWKSCWKFIQTPKSISYLHCVFVGNWLGNSLMPKAYAISRLEKNHPPLDRWGVGVKNWNNWIAVFKWCAKCLEWWKLLTFLFGRDLLGQKQKDHCIISCSSARQGPGVPSPPKRGFPSMFCEDHRDRKGDRDEWRKYGSPLGWKNGVFCNG